MTATLLLLTMLGQSPDDTATAALALARAARERPVVAIIDAPKAATYADVRASVLAGLTVTVYVRQNPPQSEPNAVRLESFAGATAGVYRCFLHTDGKPSYERVDAVPEPTPLRGEGTRTMIVPPGNHAHRMPNGETIIHGNENVGNAAAHSGLTRPWTRIAEAGQTVKAPPTAAAPPAYIPLQSFFPAASSCPNGNCPTAAPQRRGLFR